MSPHAIDRRCFLKTSSAAAAGLTLAASGLTTARAEDAQQLFQISLAEWSLHRTLFDGKLDHLDFAKTAKEDFGISAVEYVNQFFKDKGRDTNYLNEMKKRAEDHGVKNLLIMIDGEGRLGDPDDGKRKEAVENHHQWVEAAKLLGCHSIRVNAASEGTYDEQVQRAADGLRQLSQFAKPYGL
ncbi:MAG: TIM barrel protein, partial [Planctomycetales bacterium]|nr:TIM barrel protein [Planctomycetales bacterium]